MTATERVTPLTFVLCYRREVYAKVRGAWVRDEDGDAKVPERPPQFSPVKSDHPTVAKEADRLNRIQERAGFRHYFFFPEVVP